MKSSPELRATAKKILIVGGDGAIGSALAGYLPQTGLEVIKTTRRKGGEGLFLDLEDLPKNLEFPGVSVAVICAGIGSVAQCESNPNLTARVNVEAPKRIIEEVVGRGGRIVFLSTTHVFDGEKSFYATGDERNPITNYGRQKAEVEFCLEEIFPGQSAIVRLTKVLTPGGGLVKNWINAWRQGNPVDAFSDMYLSPVSLEFAVGALAKVIEESLSGKVHVSADGETSYFDFALELAERLGIERKLIRGISYKDAIKHPMPARASLAPSFGEVEFNSVASHNRLKRFIKEIARRV